MSVKMSASVFVVASLSKSVPHFYWFVLLHVFFSAQQQIFNKGKFSQYFWNNCAKFVFPVSDNDSISRRKDAGTTEVVRGRCHRFVLRCFCLEENID